MRDIHSEEFRLARKFCFLFAKAQDGLGIYASVKDLPLKAQLEAILQGAMENPAAVDEGTYSLAYMLSRQPNNQGSSANEPQLTQPEQSAPGPSIQQEYRR